jgi:hypothetical protein
MVEMMDRAEKTNRQLQLAALMAVIPVVVLITISMLTSDDLPIYQYILPIASFVAGHTLASIPQMDKTEMREHRAWEKKQT